MINCFPVSVQKVKRALLEYPLSGAVNPGKDEEPEKKKIAKERRTAVVLLLRGQNLI